MKSDPCKSMVVVSVCLDTSKFKAGLEHAWQLLSPAIVHVHMISVGILSMKILAGQVPCGTTHLSNVLACRETNARIQRRVAEICEVDPETLFGPFTHKSLRSAQAAR